MNALPRVNPHPFLKQEHLGLTVDELRDEVARLAAAARDEFERCGGPSKRLALTVLDWRHYLSMLERVERGYEEDVDGPREGDVYLLTSSARTPGHWARLARTPVYGKARRQMIARLTGRLLADGVDPEVVHALMLGQNTARARPPLRSATVVETVRWAMARELEKLEAAA
ncbi:MAG: hypothetical protein WKF33_01390 [Thermoleophilaceae bacterium]